MHCGNDVEVFAVGSNIHQMGFPVTSAWEQKRVQAEEWGVGGWGEVELKSDGDRAIGERAEPANALGQQEGERKKTKAERRL